MSESLKDKVALVVGGSSGIGQMTALTFARSGARVAVAGRRVAELNETMHQIHEAGGEAIAVPTDVTRATDVAALVEKVIQEYGRLDYAFNCAGIGYSGGLIELCEEDWDQMVAVNLKGVWLSLKYEIPAMLRTGGGAIVNMASVGGLIGTPGLSAYSATKGGVIALSRAAAMEYVKANIRINAVSPGGVNTAMLLNAPPEVRALIEGAHPIGRTGTTQEIAKAVVWLCSDEASFVLGHNMIIDGGATAQ